MTATKTYSSCIEECNTCAAACDVCFAACLKESDVQMMGAASCLMRTAQPSVALQHQQWLVIAKWPNKYVACAVKSAWPALMNVVDIHMIIAKRVQVHAESVPQLVKR